MISRADAFLFVMDVDKEIAETLGEQPLSNETLATPQQTQVTAPKPEPTGKKPQKKARAGTKWSSQVEKVTYFTPRMIRGKQIRIKDADGVKRVRFRRK